MLPFLGEDYKEGMKFLLKRRARVNVSVSKPLGEKENTRKKANDMVMNSKGRREIDVPECKNRKKRDFRGVLTFARQPEGGRGVIGKGEARIEGTPRDLAEKARPSKLRKKTRLPISKKRKNQARRGEKKDFAFPIERGGKLRSQQRCEK